MSNIIENYRKYEIQNFRYDEALDGIRNFLFRKKAYSCCSDIYEEYYKLEQLGHMGHVREYTVKEVINFLSKIGFLTQQVVYRGLFETHSKNMLIRFLPRFRPFFSVIATKYPSSDI